jgi:hypothetical protein
MTTFIARSSWLPRSKMYEPESLYQLLDVMNKYRGREIP